MHILGQKEVVHQTLGDTAPLALFLYSYTSLSSLKEGCHSIDDQGGVRVGVSPELAEVCPAVHGLFLVRLVGGGGGEFDLGLGVIATAWLAGHQA